MKSQTKMGLLVAGIVIFLFLSAIFTIQGYKNRAFNREEQIETAQSNIKVYEKRRADLIPNLVETVKAYDAHEYETLIAVIEARNIQNLGGVESDAAITEIQTMIQAVAESYPELKSNENYKNLMIELTNTENQIADYRKNYNTQVKHYNQYVRSFPARMYLSWTGYHKQDYERLDFNVSSDAPKVDFNN